MLEEPPPFRASAPGLAVPCEVEAVVMKALIKNRDERYPTMLEFSADFTRAASAPNPKEASELPPTAKVGTLDHELAEQERLARERLAREIEEAKRRELAQAAAELAARERARQEKLAREQRGAERREPAKVADALAARDKARSEPRDVSPLVPGAVRLNPKDGLKYVWIPPGSFEMGCSPGDNECASDEKPPHRVTIAKGFWLGQTEVTVGAYKRFARATGKAMPAAVDFNPGWSNEQMPIVNVSWKDAQEYCTWAGGRLPTEAEWEYAARAGDTASRYGDLGEIAWYADNSGQKTHEVGQKRANSFGLFDMLGNVSEWVNDWYDENYYQNSPSQDPKGPASGGLSRSAWRVLVRQSQERPRIVPRLAHSRQQEQLPRVPLWRGSVRSLTLFPLALTPCSGARSVRRLQAGHSDRPGSVALILIQRGRGTPRPYGNLHEQRIVRGQSTRADLKAGATISLRLCRATLPSLRPAG